LKWNVGQVRRALNPDCRAEAVREAVEAGRMESRPHPIQQPIFAADRRIALLFTKRKVMQNNAYSRSRPKLRHSSPKYESSDQASKNVNQNESMMTVIN
jgi:hypothetical protein